MLSWLETLLRRSSSAPTPIPHVLWHKVLDSYSFLAALDTQDALSLRTLSGQFLSAKEFTGAQGLVVTDEMALAIAAQACLPVLHLGLQAYDEFKGIVVHPGAMLARREVTDAAGVVHRFSEVLSGEAMLGGPVTLSWQDVQASGESATMGYNVVIHEFVHKLDMRDGAANGCPPLPTRAARAIWQTAMQQAYAEFREAVVMAERFGGAPPWLDAYAAQSPAEFFAVAAEAYFVNRQRFTEELAILLPVFDDYFRNKGL